MRAGLALARESTLIVLAHQVIEFLVVLQAERVLEEVGNVAVLVEDEDHLVRAGRPGPGDHVVRGGVQRGRGGHLVEGVRLHHRPEGAPAETGLHLLHRLVGADLHGLLGRIGLVDLRNDVVVVLDRVDHRVDVAAVVVQIGFQRGQVVGLRVADPVGESAQLGDADLAVGRRFGVLGVRGRHGQRGGHVDAGLLDCQRIRAQRLFFGLCDVCVRPVGQREDRGDADDADGPREGGHEGAALLRHQVIEGEGQGGQEAHRRATRGLGLAAVFGGGHEGVGVGDDAAVGQLDDAGRVLVGQLGVVRDHDDEAVAGHVAQQIHDLHARLGVEGARGFVGQQDLRVIDEGARDGDALHLAARHLRGLLVDVVLQADAFKSVEGALAALGAGDAREGQCQLDVRENALVGDQVVGLEDESDAVVAVGVPVARLVVFRRNAIDDEVAALEAVEAADDVEHRRLAGAGLAQHGHKLVVAERHGDLVERHLHEVGGLVGLDDLLEL